MAKYWIKDDMIKNQSNLDKLITNFDSKCRVCWLFMENHKYYITDSETKLLASFNNNKMSIKLKNNSNLGVQISLKKYLYSSMVNLQSKKYVIIFINELELKVHDLIDLTDIVPYGPIILYSEQILTNAQINSKITQSFLEEAQIANSKISKPNDDDNNLSNLIHSMTPTSSLKNCTLEIIEENLNRSDDIVLNLNNAFNKNSDYEFNNNQSSADKTPSFLSNSENVIKSSDIVDNLLNLESISVINDNDNLTNEVNTNPLKINEERNNLQNGLKFLSGTRLSRCSSVDYMSDSHSVISINSNFKRKRKLMSKHSKISDQFENDSNKSPEADKVIFLTNTPSKVQSSRSSSTSSTNTSHSSSSSSLCDSSSSLTNIQSKSSIFAPKKMIDNIFQKSFSDKKVIKNKNLHNLFSPINSKKKLRISNLFEPKNVDLLKESSQNINIIKNTENDSTNKNVFDKYKSLNIDESVKKQRRKRLFDPLSHIIDETSFENNSDTSETHKINKIVQETMLLTSNKTNKRNFETLSQKDSTPDKTALNSSTINNESIPAGQNRANEQTKLNTTDSNLFELSKTNLTSKQEELMNLKFKIEPNKLQIYLKNHVINNNCYD